MTITPAPDAVRLVPEPRAIADAPRDGTMLRLWVRYPEDGSWTPLDDAHESWTIGFNNFDNTEDDRWQVVGWNWSHDYLVEAASDVEVLGWLPFHGAAAPAPATARGGDATGAKAVIRHGQIVISIDVDALPLILSGSIAVGAVRGTLKVTDADEFAKEVCAALNTESENGTTRVHKMFDSAFDHAIDQGAEGVEEISDDEFETEAVRLRSETALASQPQATGGAVEREAIARIIEPDAERLIEDAAWGEDRKSARQDWKSALAKADDILAAIATQPAPSPCGVIERLREMRAFAVEMISKHGNPIGTPYEEGQNDMGHRWVTSIDQALVSLGAQPLPAAPSIQKGEEG